MAFLRGLGWLLWLSVAALAGLALLILARGVAGEGSAGPLALSRPVGPFTAARVAGLAGDAARCRTLLSRAGIAFRALPARTDGQHCGFADGVAWAPDGARQAAYAPHAPPLACPLAAALALWEWDVVQPAAARLLGTTVVAVDHYGTYACRRIYGRAAGAWSEHARAAAIDVAGFRLADGRRVTVAADWRGQGPEATFLHRVRNGACRLFATTLSPDYNAAHRDHLHLDEAARGGGRACR